MSIVPFRFRAQMKSIQNSIFAQTPGSGELGLDLVAVSGDTHESFEYIVINNKPYHVFGIEHGEQRGRFLGYPDTESAAILWDSILLKVAHAAVG